MLVLTRRIGEEIVIGGEVRVRIIAVRGDRVRLGITAPERIRVDRQEVHSRRNQFLLAEPGDLTVSPVAVAP